VWAMSRIYLSYDPEQRLLMPPDLREWLPEGHLALFVEAREETIRYAAVALTLSGT